jgi:antitoxin (DNA-binding transcriptional repressor) of toxin-antitoxin stability system
MKSLGIRQAKAHLSALARAATSGECSLVSDNGRVVAMIGPPPQDPALARGIESSVLVSFGAGPRQKTCGPHNRAPGCRARGNRLVTAQSRPGGWRNVALRQFNCLLAEHYAEQAHERNQRRSRGPHLNEA